MITRCRKSYPSGKGPYPTLFVYDITLAIDLNTADSRIIAGEERRRLRRKTRAPQHFEHRPAPLRLVQEGSGFDLGH